MARTVESTGLAFTEVLKFTVIGKNEEERQRIISNLCVIKQQRSAVLTAKDGEVHTFGSKYVSLEDEEFFRKQGLKVDVTLHPRRDGVADIEGMPVIVKAVNGNFDNGCYVDIVCEADTFKRLGACKKAATDKFNAFCAKNGLPKARECVIACVDKYRDVATVYKGKAACSF